MRYTVHSDADIALTPTSKRQHVDSCTWLPVKQIDRTDGCPAAGDHAFILSYLIATLDNQDYPLGIKTINHIVN